MIRRHARAGLFATFLVAAAVESVLSPLIGRISDRHGRIVPLRFGLACATALLLCFTLPAMAGLLAALIVVIAAALGMFWAPAMALLSDASEEAGLDQALAFSISNLGWATGILVGSGGGGALAEATADGVPYALLSAICAATLAAVIALGRAVPARSAATR
jgi:MFS family permease